MKHQNQTRCEEVIVQLVIRTYDAAGCPVREQMSQPTKVLRNARTANFWGEVDKAVKAMQQQPPATPPNPVPPAVLRMKRR